MPTTNFTLSLGCCVIGVCMAARYGGLLVCLRCGGERWYGVGEQRSARPTALVAQISQQHSRSQSFESTAARGLAAGR